MNDKCTIAIVDDNEAFRDSLAALLQSAGHAVKVFASGREFLVANFALFGCAIVDVLMPGTSGLAVLKFVVSSGLSLPVIIVTGHGDIPLAVKSLRAGAVDFIEKPFTDRAILASVQHAMDIKGGSARGGTQGRHIRERVSKLTVRERQVFDHLVSGLSNKEIAIKLGISPRTVEIHRARVMQKIQARNLVELVRMAVIGNLDLGTGSTLA